MNGIVEWITSYAQHAHWLLFGLTLLAGVNLPVSIDLVLFCAAFLSARFVPEHTVLLFLSTLLGCYLSGWCGYWFGRLLCPYLAKVRVFSWLLKVERLEKVRKFYEKWGAPAYIIGRFIPFGVRNCLFMSSGLSKAPFKRFALIDAVGCSLWCSTMFFLFYTLSRNYEVLWHYLKVFNLVIFLFFGVTVIAIIWYKSRKKRRDTDVS